MFVTNSRPPTNTHLCGQIDCGWEVSSIEERLRPRHLLLGHFNLLQLRGVTRSRISAIDWTTRVRGGEREQTVSVAHNENMPLIVAVKLHARFIVCGCGSWYRQQQ